RSKPISPRPRGPQLGHPNSNLLRCSAVQTKDQTGGPYARLAWWLSGLAVITGLVYLMATANTGPTDPTESAQPMSHATAVFNSGMIVFREGLEAILIFAAVTASFLGANASKRRPVVAGTA